MGYPNSDTRVQRIEVKLQGDVEFLPFTLKTPESPAAPSEGPCTLNKAIAYRSISFPAVYNASIVRCSVYEDESSTSPLVSSAEIPIYLLPGKRNYLLYDISP